MAKHQAAWGIDIGQCALKALRCLSDDDPDSDQIIADAFDYIEYPKILNQPDAEPAELIHSALEQFLSRNSVQGDRVAISVSGQSGLARFIKLPPIESKKIPDIVNYEAKQQIPFNLNEVVWDYQRMAGGNEEEGFALEVEIGLFAMKRDQVFEALAPLTEVGIDVDIVQLTPLAIYNFVVFDQFRNNLPLDEYDPEDPPESLVVLSMGTDTTDLVITNGYRVWQRSIPIGGSHFTKALTKELKLTFSKAEHLKRNATKAENPKAVFQAMRPVFSDLLTEIQRSIGYFTNLDRNAKIKRVMALGNSMKLPGLQNYFVQNLGYEVLEVDDYRGLKGSEVVSAPAFKGNKLSFVVCYGLALQGLDQAELKTNLVPREIIRDRVIRGKKPWAVAAVATLLLGFTLGFLGNYRFWSSANVKSFKSAIGDKSDKDEINIKIIGTVAKYKVQYEKKLKELEKYKSIGKSLIVNVDERYYWPEIFKAIAEALPSDPPGQKPEDIRLRRELHIMKIGFDYFEDLSSWNPINNQAAPNPKQKKAAGRAKANQRKRPSTGRRPGRKPNPKKTTPKKLVSSGGQSGKGWVVKMEGYHLWNHEKNADKRDRTFLEDTLIKNLGEKSNKTISLPNPSNNGKHSLISIKDLGISKPVITKFGDLKPSHVGNSGNPPPLKCDFALEFAWKPKTLNSRDWKSKRKKRAGR